MYEIFFQTLKNKVSCNEEEPEVVKTCLTHTANHSYTWRLPATTVHIGFKDE